MRFGQNVLRMTRKERLVEFSWEAHCFPFLARISGRSDDFENFDAQKCDLAKTCCAWPEKSVLYNFHGKRTVFPSWREFQPSFAILRTLTVKNAIWPKRAAHDLKRAFCTMTWKEHSFDDFENFHAHKIRLKRAPHDLKSAKAVFPIWPTILRTLTLVYRFEEKKGQNVTFCTIFKNAIWPKRAAHDLKRAFCTIVEKSVLYNLESALFYRFQENLRPVWRFWELSRSKMRFGQNVLRMTWKERFVQFSWKAHCFPVLKRISAQFCDFENFDAQKCDLAKTCCAWPEKSVLYNCYQKRTVFPIWGEFKASLTILRTLTLKNAIWPKRAAHDLKRAFCTIFI